MSDANDDEVRALIEAARGAHTSPPGAKERVLARVRRAPTGGGGSSPMPWLLAGAGVVIALVAWLARSHDSAVEDPPRAPSAPTVVPAPAVDRRSAGDPAPRPELAPPVAAPDPVPAAPLEVGEETAVPSEQAQEPPAPARVRPRPPREAAESQPPTIEAPEAPEVAPTAPSTPADELALLMRAQRELRSGASASARATVAEHRQLHPSSPFEVERATIDALAACALGEAEEARRIAQPVLRDHPRSPSADRLRRSCAGPEPAP